ncbi:MAG: hypothetical protein AAGE96_12180, partial [Cyanobacteria bacterium P01_G01_bin.19]
FENKYGKENVEKKYLDLATNSRELLFSEEPRIEPHYIPECDLVSEETAYIILRRFLDEEIEEESLDPKIFRQEVLKRNYT